MANTYVNDAGTWRNIRNIYVNDAGTWRTIRQVYVNDAGTWRSVWSSTLMPNISVARSDDGTPASLNITNVGTVSGTDPGPSTVQLGEWTTDPNTSDYEIFVTVTSGSFSSGTTGAWLNMGSTWTFTRGAAAGTDQSVSFTVQLRRVSTGEAINTASGVLLCSRA